MGATAAMLAMEAMGALGAMEQPDMAGMGGLGATRATGGTAETQLEAEYMHRIYSFIIPIRVDLSRPAAEELLVMQAQVGRREKEVNRMGPTAIQGTQAHPVRTALLLIVAFTAPPETM